ncbi:peptidase T [Tannerella sp. oral taxon BU063 isolate Cell 2]|uniref:Peptidase T n=1 Tax=Tannerella sp. oral taxon BU063 isolate Cell 2 TaxID=1411148 RepID=W2C2E1_9BACT|nr:peptidase T [Tannerella sp. oral taxon BU063 isolate Cell 2]
MTITDRFLRYTALDTQSDEHARSMPSTPGQMRFAESLTEELKALGLHDVSLDENGYVMATLPANTSRTDVPVIGFIAHMDTSPDMSGRDVKPRIVAYAGGDIVLNESLGVVLSPDVFPELNHYVGQELIVTDGTTLLGADDKAGVAAIVSAMEYLLAHPEVEHGTVRIAFTPDEEIGRGADRFDVARFGCFGAYTVDGGELGELEYENFNAAQAVVTLRGRNIHPGSAKGRMINASLVAMQLNEMLPPAERPETTEGREGFFHLTEMAGSVEEAQLTYIIRDHDRALFEKKKETLREAVRRINETYPESCTLDMRDQYYNMREVIDRRPELIQWARQAMEAAGVTPIERPIRGGTDGARLSFMGLPCPNLFAGGMNFHGRYEYLPVPSLQKSMETIIHLCHIITK